MSKALIELEKGMRNVRDGMNQKNIKVNQKRKF